MISAFQKPFSNWKALLIGALIGIIPIFGSVLILGFIMENMGKAKMEDWKLKKMGRYIVNGLVALLYFFVYFFIPLVIIGIIAIAAFLSYFKINDFVNIENLILKAGLPIIIGIILFIVLAALLGCVLAAAVIEYSKKRKIKLTSKYFSYVTNLKFLLNYAIAVLYIGILKFISFTTLSIPVIGFILSLILEGAAYYIGTTTQYALLYKIVR
ncbi:MAG: hypothetical protein DRO04_01505 [Candidatus Iainarchaeum archaeon]|uniref:DUF4013 domain-containing protein n=1 Tax=Candidatus Iainarchaeum sp. TaxID=3101447 RepID=A0A497JHR3_9ARCH|nr:MAG: hypothetical protein DRO04_01505 [Candidatus Diapherotrites archaeon]